MSSVLVAPLVWKCTNDVIEFFKDYYFLLISNPKQCASYYAFKKVMCHIRRVTWCHIKVFKAFCENTWFFNSSCPTLFSLAISTCAWWHSFDRRGNFPAITSVWISARQAVQNLQKCSTEMLFTKPPRECAGRLSATIHCTVPLINVPNISTNSQFFSKMVISCKSGWKIFL